METNKETQESNRAKLLNFLKIDKNVQKLLKLFYPLTSVESGELLFIGLKWKVFYLFNSSSLITGDNPFARKLDGIDNNGLLGEFIFPISKDKLLLITEEEPKFVESFFALYLNLTILFQSERFICCDNKEYLDKLILIYKDFQKENLCADIKNLLFDRLKYISSFNSKEDFFVEINKDVKY
jgi:hypothetical protein